MKLYKNILLAIWSLIYVVTVVFFVRGSLTSVPFGCLTIGFLCYLIAFFHNLSKEVKK